MFTFSSLSSSSSSAFTAIVPSILNIEIHAAVPSNDFAAIFLLGEFKGISVLSKSYINKTLDVSIFGENKTKFKNLPSLPLGLQPLPVRLFIVVANALYIFGLSENV